MGTSPMLTSGGWWRIVISVSPTTGNFFIQKTCFSVHLIIRGKKEKTLAWECHIWFCVMTEAWSMHEQCQSSEGLSSHQARSVRANHSPCHEVRQKHWCCGCGPCAPGGRKTLLNQLCCSNKATDRLANMLCVLNKYTGNSSLCRYQNNN